MSNYADQGGFVFFPSYRIQFDLLKRDPNKAIEFIDALCNFAFDGKEPENISLEVELCFAAARPLIEGGKQAKAEASERGKRGGAPKGNKNALRKNPAPDIDYSGLFNKADGEG